jgi:hypothetical protein
VTTVTKIDGRFAPKYQKSRRESIRNTPPAASVVMTGPMKLGGGNKFSSSARPGSEAKIQKMPPSSFVRRLAAQFASRIHPFERAAIEMDSETLQEFSARQMPRRRTDNNWPCFKGGILISRYYDLK